jgi:hypothetical protein
MQTSGQGIGGTVRPSSPRNAPRGIDLGYACDRSLEPCLVGRRSAALRLQHVEGALTVLALVDQSECLVLPGGDPLAQHVDLIAQVSGIAGSEAPGVEAPLFTHQLLLVEFHLPLGAVFGQIHRSE